MITLVTESTHSTYSASTGVQTILHTEMIHDLNSTIYQLNHKNLSKAYYHIYKVQNILIYLTKNLNPYSNNEKQLLQMYRYISRQLVRAYICRSTIMINEMIDILSQIKDA